MKGKLNLSLLALAVAAVLFIGGQWNFTNRQTDIEQNSQTTAALVRATAKQAHANCVVLSVLLTNRSDRDATIKLFDPIRRENPAQFDALVKRAEDGDKRLARVQGDLACRVENDVPERHPGRY